MTIAPGLVSELALVVEEAMTAEHAGNAGFKVLSTPALVQAFEAAAIELLKPHLAPNEGTVGTSTAVGRLAATPIGMRVSCRAELTEVDGRRLRFQIEANDEREKIGEAVHERVVVNREKLLARVDAKASR